MFDSILTKAITANPLVLGNIFSGATTGFKSLQGELSLAGTALAGVALVCGFAAHSLGRKASAEGKSLIVNGLITVCGIALTGAIISYAISWSGQGF
ncbi:hypothetical protein [Latilactobacillus fragifolii]|uniref:hypothetical protein n=1 Tax=Latilactobacillus fragifolii TaxID=2814244 RepID=UPI001ABA7C6A|nr:hypothetical protein [Latilactobacillus fragifolii]